MHWLKNKQTKTTSNPWKPKHPATNILFRKMDLRFYFKVLLVIKIIFPLLYFLNQSIQNWKTKKLQKREEIFKEKAEDIPMLFHNKQEDNQKQKEEQRKQQKLAVEAWKKQKSIEMSMKYASQLKEEEEKEKRQQKERQRQFKLKLLLENYTQQKKEQEEFLRLEKEIREKTEKAGKRKTVADEISRFQERVSKYVF